MYGHAWLGLKLLTLKGIVMFDFHYLMRVLRSEAQNNPGAGVDGVPLS